MENKSFYADIPTLAAKEMELDSKVEGIQSEISKIKHHPRFESNPSERDFRISELNDQLETTLAKAEEDFQIELEVTEQALAVQMFQAPKTDVETAQSADKLAEDITAQIAISPSTADHVAMLAVRARTMTDAERYSLSRKMPEINSHVLSKVDGLPQSERAEVLKNLEAVGSIASDTAVTRSVREQMDALKRIKKGGASVTAKYRQQDIARKIAKQDIGQGAIGRDFWESVAKGGRK